MAALNWPHTQSMAEVINTVRDDEVPVKHLFCNFDDENFDSSLELRNVVLVYKMSGKIPSLIIVNGCNDQELYNQCFDFVIQCIEGPHGKIPNFRYLSISKFSAISLASANRFADAITSNHTMEQLGVLVNFREPGTFECIFGAVLDKGTVRAFGLYLSHKSMEDIMGRNCIGNSNLGTNTTLKHLIIPSFGINVGNVGNVVEEWMEQVADAIKVNRGLSSISISGEFMTNNGRRNLLSSLHYNNNIIKLDTTLLALPSSVPPVIEIEEEDSNERIVLQSQIDNHTELNNTWNTLKEAFFRFDLGKTMTLWKGRKRKRIHVSLIYPSFLESIAQKPLLLYSFLQKKNQALFHDYSERNENRPRRSMRLLKKRRIESGRDG